MNCIDFRRNFLADPRRSDDDTRLHAAACAGCRVFAERQRELDARLHEAMAIAPPEGLADRILLEQSPRQRTKSWPWAIAAALVLAAGLAYVVPARLSGDRLAREAVMHAVEEREAFRSRARFAPGYLDNALSGQGLRLAAAIGEVTFSRLCPLAGNTARHLVITMPEGQVTLFLLPADAERRQRIEVASEGMVSIALPAARGSVAIVAANATIARAVEQALARA